MQLAQYFARGQLPEEESWRHYALAFDKYTHFTSPIRRYPDILVHRLLPCEFSRGRTRENKKKQKNKMMSFFSKKKSSDDVVVKKSNKLVDYLLPTSTSSCIQIATQCNIKKASAKVRARRTLVRVFLLPSREEPNGYAGYRAHPSEGNI